MSANQRHQIIEQLGYGDVDTIYRAHDTQLHHEVALRKITHSDDPLKQNIQQKLISEAQALSQLNHPNIVTIYEIQNFEKHDEIIMELLYGISLNTLVERHLPLPQDFILVATEILSAVATAHAHNIIHADLRPENIMLCGLPNQSYVVKVINFGYSPEARKALKINQSSGVLDKSIHFMAPEQFQVNDPTTLSDIYSLGCLFYFLLTGIHPFQGENEEQIINAHQCGQFIPLKTLRPDAPDALCNWLNAHIFVDPTARIQSCQQSLEALLALTIIQAENAYRLPVHPAASTVSREVRPLTMQSLNTNSYTAPPLPESAQFNPASLTKARFSEAQEKEAQKKLRHSVQTPVKKPPIPLSQRVRQVPAQEQWYFSLLGNRKGPVNFEKLCTLIQEGHVKQNDLVWHPRFGEWNPVSSIPEFKEEIDKGAKELKKLAKAKSKPTQPPATVQQVPQLGQTKNPQPVVAKHHNIDEDLEEFHWVGGEFIFLLAAPSATSLFLWYHPDLWQISFLLLACASILAGYIFMRIHMKRVSNKWLAAGLALPILSDLFYLLAHPIIGLRSLALWAFAAGLIHFSLEHRYSNDVFAMIGIPDPITATQNFYEDQIEKLSDLEFFGLFK